MSFADNYFSKHKSLVPHIQEPPQGLLRYIVVIPAYLEENVEYTLKSLLNAKETEGQREVLVIVNYSITDSEENKKESLILFDGLKIWCAKYSTNSLKFQTLLASDLPNKHAGAGLARKIGMDEALHRFAQIENHRGIILSLDADTLVDKNYFVSIEQVEVTHPDVGGFIYQFNHPISGKDFSDDVYDAMVLYELHLRYYKHAIAYTGFPYANYTIGSCFGVMANYYAEQGGMNRRQAGEDFYFLNKLFPHKEFISIRNSCVYPSPRISNRVPFGTGPTIGDIVENQGYYESYAPESFLALKQFFDSIQSLHSARNGGDERIWKSYPESIREFLNNKGFKDKLDEIRKNTSSAESFTKRFYQWFDAFAIVKFLNFTHNNYYKKLPVFETVEQFFELIGFKLGFKSSREYLNYFRQLDREGKNLGEHIS